MLRIASSDFVGQSIFLPRIDDVFLLLLMHSSWTREQTRCRRADLVDSGLFYPILLLHLPNKARLLLRHALFLPRLPIFEVIGVACRLFLRGFTSIT